MAKPCESKREEFRKYLEKTGVFDALTKCLVNLYEEADKPDDALTYIRNKLSLLSGGETIEYYKEELEKANNKIAELEQEIETLKNPPGEGDSIKPEEPGQETPANNETIE